MKLFVLPKFILRRHRGISKQVGIGPDGRLKRMNHDIWNMREWNFIDYIIAITSHFRERELKLQKLNHHLTQLESQKLNEFRIVQLAWFRQEFD